MPDYCIFISNRVWKKLRLRAEVARGAVGMLIQFSTCGSTRWWLVTGHHVNGLLFSSLTLPDEEKEVSALSPLSGFVKQMQWYRQHALEAFEGSPPRTLPSQLLRGAGPLMIRWWKEPNLIKDDAALVYFHLRFHCSCPLSHGPSPTAFTGLKSLFAASVPRHATGTSAAWISSVFSRLKYYQRADVEFKSLQISRPYYKIKSEMQKLGYLLHTGVRFFLKLIGSRKGVETPNEACITKWTGGNVTVRGLTDISLLSWKQLLQITWKTVNHRYRTSILAYFPCSIPFQKLLFLLHF